MTAKLSFLPILSILFVGLPAGGTRLEAQVAHAVAVERRDAPALPVGRLDEAAPTGSTARMVLRVAGGSVLGAALGGGAGYAIGAVRCGRRKGCTPAEAYPYPRFGVVAGAVVGGGIAWGTGRPASTLRFAAAGMARSLAPQALAWLAPGARRGPVAVAVRLAVPAFGR